ncbi:heparan sulfate 2-O-sulfotransferase pipe [Ischnura elegans]|uniref:heparan sulfate 2-O-sulfotransferase pipe n=1 Tax=Ischnura elegans TaxID=197161 RepID=UPI001ED8AEEB|nr:heparan sulfate 2-O-sulfotransferase pipe [Ischnura elegans]
MEAGYKPQTTFRWTAMDNIFRIWRGVLARRLHVPKRTTELVAFLALSTTVFLFIHTRDLHTRLRHMEGRLTSEDETAAAAQAQSVFGSTFPPQVSPASASSPSRPSSVTPQRHLDPPRPQNIIERARGGRAVFSAADTANEIHGSQESSPPSGSGSSSHGAAAVGGPSAEVTAVEPPWALNNTGRANLDVIFFNRVPKVGSQMFMDLLHRLSVRNGFEFRRDQIHRMETIRVRPEDELRLGAMVASIPPPAVYVKHVCFTNFTKFGLPEPIYVNMVRDPVERVISWYYYVRAPWYYVERKQAFPDLPLPDPKWLRKDFETCVLSGDSECRYIEGNIRDGIGDHRRQSMFFCGHGDECTPFNSEGAIQKAKWSVEHHYSVVGVLEDLNKTLAVLEGYIPRFFSGAQRVHIDQMSHFPHINRNPFKPPVREEVKNIVRRNFTREIDFYEFCKQRLHRQYAAMKLANL